MPDFSKYQGFERIWLEDNLNFNHKPKKELPDDDYIDYHQWEEKNHKLLYEKHMPTWNISRGEHDGKIIFHGGCLRCNSQQLSGIQRCKRCLYFKFDQSKPDISI